MGLCGSTVESQIPQGWMELFANLKLTRAEVQKLYDIFRKADMDGSGFVDTVELLTLLDIERTRFTEQIFTIFDNDGSGKIDFREFVMSVWNYCTIGKAALDIFTFDLYDADSSGELSTKEVSQMLKDIYGKSHMNDAKVKMIQADLAKIDSKTRINLTAFKNFTQTHQGMLFPVFNMQYQLRQKVLGDRFWDKASNRRVELSKGRYVTMSDLMLLHLNQGLYNRAVSDSNMLRMSSNARLIIKATGTNQRRQSTDPQHHTKHIGPPTSDNSAADDGTIGPPPSGSATRGSALITYSNKPGYENGQASTSGSFAVPDSGAGTSGTQTQQQPQAPPSSKQGGASRGFGSFLTGGKAGAGTGTGAVVASSKKQHHGHHHGHGHGHGGHKHGSLLMSTALAADGSDVYFDNSGKCKPVHATGRHMHDVNAVNKRRNSVNPSG